MAEPTGQISCGLIVLDDWDCVTYQLAGEDVTQCYPPGTGSSIITPCVGGCCNFPTSFYQDDGAGGLHCFGQPAAGVCNIPAGTWIVSAGGDTSPFAGTMLVQFSDGQQMFEDANTYNCGDFSEEPPPVSNSMTFTFAAPVTATLYFEQDNGAGTPFPITNPFICYDCP